MASGLKRDLGLLSTTALAIGAMVGSGIFILPAIAYADAGPAAVLAFGIAGLLVLPAAMSAAEMATAMPEDGGAYIYVERGMGPLLGTVAGIGTWLMLSLKGSLALVGGVPYLVILAPTLAEYIVAFAVVLALFFTLVNAVSAKGSGTVQFVIVGVMLAAMAYFVLGGAGSVDPGQTAGSFDPTSGGILAAIGAVFVSYAGVTKVTAVAEEVKNPGRNLPLAMVGSLVFTTALYMGIVYVAIGVVDLTPGAGFVPEPGEPGDPAPIAAAADAVFGQVGVIVIVLAALLALASTANAGILAASRFPLAMARDGLVPPALERVSDRFSTPVNAIALTGGVVILIVTFLPVEQVARFGSAFQILVFVLLNVALIGFREGAIEEYQPEFTAPLYPWTQLFGVVSGLVVLTQMGLVPFAGAMGIVLLSLVWYLWYARPRVEREGAAQTGVRRNLGQEAVERTRELFEGDGTYEVLVAITDRTTESARRDMVRVAADLSRLRREHVTVARFDEVPHRVFTASGPRVRTADVPDWLDFEEGEAPPWFPVEEVATDGAPLARNALIDYREVATEDVREAIVEYAAYEGADLIVLERSRVEPYERLFGGDLSWILANAPCDVVLVESRELDGIDEVVVAAGRGAFDPLKLLIADAIAEEAEAAITLMGAVPTDAPESRKATIREYHDALASICTVPVTPRLIETDDRVAGMARFAADADLLVTGAERGGIEGVLLGRPGDRLVEAVDCTAVMVQTREGSRGGLVKRLVLDRLFG